MSAVQHVYSTATNSSEEDLESDDEGCNTSEERKFVVFESQLLVLSHSVHNMEK